jgi:polyphosphate kinase
MERNFFTRLEVMYPVTRAPLRRRVIADLERDLEDDCYSWEMAPDGSWRRLVRPDGDGVSVQAERLDRLAQRLSGS